MTIKIKVLKAAEDGSAKGKIINLKPEHDCLSLYDKVRETVVLRIQNVEGKLMVTYYPAIDSTKLERGDGC